MDTGGFLSPYLEETSGVVVSEMAKVVASKTPKLMVERGVIPASSLEFPAAFKTL